jgi:hypothetical protein
LPFFSIRRTPSTVISTPPFSSADDKLKALPTNVRQEDADKLIKACERAEGRFKVIHAAYNAAYDMQQVQSRIPFA